VKESDISKAKSKSGRKSGRVRTIRKSALIHQVNRDILTAPRQSLTSGEAELAAVFREMDNGRPPIEENEESTRLIQEEIRKYRAERRGRK
jgi:hypothetical protein